MSETQGGQQLIATTTDAVGVGTVSQRIIDQAKEQTVSFLLLFTSMSNSHISKNYERRSFSFGIRLTDSSMIYTVCLLTVLIFHYLLTTLIPVSEDVFILPISNDLTLALI